MLSLRATRTDTTCHKTTIVIMQILARPLNMTHLHLSQVGNHGVCALAGCFSRAAHHSRLPLPVTACALAVCKRYVYTFLLIFMHLGGGYTA